MFNKFYNFNLKKRQLFKQDRYNRKLYDLFTKLQRNMLMRQKIEKSFNIVSGVLANSGRCTLTLDHLKKSYYREVHSVLNKDSDLIKLRQKCSNIANLLRNFKRLF